MKTQRGKSEQKNDQGLMSFIPRLEINSHMRQRIEIETKKKKKIIIRRRQFSIISIRVMNLYLKKEDNIMVLRHYQQIVRLIDRC